MNQIFSIFKNERLFSWIKLISITGGSQIAIQILGLLSGFIIIRLLPLQEYGLYTIANTMLGTMTMLSDGGISAGVMAEGGKVWNDKKKLGLVLFTGFELRRKFAIVSLIITIPILLYLLFQNGASWVNGVIIALCLIPAFYAALSDSLLEVSLKLHQSIIPLQKNQLIVSLGRLILSVISLIFFPFTYIAILASGIPRIYGNLQLHKLSFKFADTSDCLLDIEIQRKIILIVKRMLPGVIYYCISGQITIWLISIFGNSIAVAQLGAIGRVVIFTSVLNTIMSTLVSPRFARLPSEKKLFASFFGKIHISLWVLCGIIIFMVWCFSSQILWLLGSNYNNLTDELLMSMIGGCISLIAGTSLSLNLSRGWIISPWISISLSIVALVVGILLFGTSNLMEVINLNIIVAINQYFLHTGYCIYKIYTVKS